MFCQMKQQYTFLAERSNKYKYHVLSDEATTLAHLLLGLKKQQ